ncbi:O-succinylbenzoate-CoA synthase [Micromonospora sp. ATCC 39149]|uniref:o-succinylbenzoate synthase n=1 Tax=Micromonospora carbonacea TaxID=47853 RepID=A0A7D5Y6N2_9ACTN|nr:o-succinylbenzoate synthase [Micromonospora sp. ATCC 39149]EEP73979.1 O-succinylbenzoate-CoA synthase [Micromonospora sp. ATCC 39149]QLJ99858.1 o-succinylbenzoate synthase [Micromonospora carbonacea]
MAAHAYAIPLRTRFRGITVREGVLMRGPHGWGEFSPFLDYGSEASARWLAACREATDEGWPAPVRTSVPVNVTVPAVGPDRAQAIVRASGGCRTAKVKVGEPGQSAGDDLDRVQAVRDALGPGGAVRVDANGAWDVDRAVRMIRLLDRVGLQYVEQPCRSLAELAAVRRRVDVPVAADEAVRLAADPTRIAGLRAAADIVVLKVQPLGGVRRALRVAEAAGLPAVVSSALETSVGLAAGLALAAALPELPYACGLGTAQLLADDPVADPLVPVEGEIPVRRPAVDAVRLSRCRPADQERTRWWLRRIAETHRELVRLAEPVEEQTCQ